jgi:hypothetical protein
LFEQLEDVTQEFVDTLSVLRQKADENAHLIEELDKAKLISEQKVVELMKQRLVT